MGISTHSWASEKDDMLVRASIEGSSRWPPEAQFSITSSGISSRIIRRKPWTAAICWRNPSPRDSAPSHPMPMLLL